MARIYEIVDRMPTGALPLPAALREMPVSNRAVRKFWLSIAALAAASVAFHIYARFAPMIPGLMVAVVYAIVFIVILVLFQLRSAYLTIHVDKASALEADRVVEQYLSQLDDRFAVFTRIQAGDAWLDHVIIGPSGIFALHNAELKGNSVSPDSVELDKARDSASELYRLLLQLAPVSEPQIEAVLCVTGDLTNTVEKERDVWVVAANKIVPSILKRSTQAGAITTNVDVTGVFSNAALNSNAIEQALNQYLGTTLRKTLHHYQPPPQMTQPDR